MTSGPETPVRPHCLVYASYSFNGHGPSQSCASIVANFPDELSTEMVIARARKPMPATVRTLQALPPVVRDLPWRFVSKHADAAVNRRFSAALRQHDPASTVVYMWPGAPLWLIREARERGFPVVREMINCTCATHGEILDAAYEALDMPPAHLATAQVIEDEIRELHEYDFVFASNPEVEASLERIGIPHDRILPVTFGWTSDKFAGSEPDPRPERGVRALFVGIIGVRKGVPELLDAWRDSGVDGELVLVGSVEPAIADLVDGHVRGGRVRLTGHVKDVGAKYGSADIFVFPTLEEGGPQVTYEAAGCGLPIITTPMGAARLVEDGRTGIVVAPGDRAQLAAALRTLGNDPGLRARYGEAARARSGEFDYRHVGLARGRRLAEIALNRQPI
jgi:glycosyltransferase involved in cell wall biosynthesis